MSEEVWALYESRVQSRGDTKYNETMKREKRYLRRHLPDNLSYETVVIDGVEQQAAVINTDNLDVKHIRSMPDEDVRHGAYIDWIGQHWLVTDRDYNNKIYTIATMQQCNYLLRWVDDDDEIREQWCIVEDGTKLRRLSFRVEKSA